MLHLGSRRHQRTRHKGAPGSALEEEHEKENRKDLSFSL